MGLKFAIPRWAFKFGGSLRRKRKEEEAAGVRNRNVDDDVSMSTLSTSEGDSAITVGVVTCVHDQRYSSSSRRQPPSTMRRQSSTSSLISVQDSICLSYEKAISEKNIVTPKLGILRLDYNYPPAVGDIDHPDSFDYPIIYRVIPGLTFEICQSGDLPDEIKVECRRAVQYLESKGVSGITGDCGFMIHIQDLISNLAKNKPVFMTSLVQLPSLCRCFNSDETIAIFTANSKTFLPILPRLLEMCALRQEDKDRIQVVGCQDVDGFDAIERGEAVDVLKVDAGIVELAKQVIEDNPRIKAILLECSELPAYAGSLKFATGLPVYDSISVCNSFMAGFLDNPKIGLNDFYQAWDGTQAEYSFGYCLSGKERGKLRSSLTNLTLHSQISTLSLHDFDDVSDDSSEGLEEMDE